METEEYNPEEDQEVVGEKKPRTGLIVALIVGGMLLIGCVCGVAMLLGGIVKFGNTVETIIEDGEEEFEEEEEDIKPVISNRKYIGDSEFGYLEVDGIWSNYEGDDNDESEMLRYSNGLYLISLYAVPKLQASSEDYEKTVIESLEKEGLEDASSEESKLGDYDAYKIKCYYANKNMHLLIWIFEAEDGKTHYISVEGPDAESDKFAIPEKFTLKKED